MRRLAAVLIVLALVAALAACSGDDDGDGGNEPAAEAEAGRWPGPPRGDSDGNVDVESFNEHVAQESASWTRSPLLAAAEFLRLDRTQARKASIVATARKEGASTRVAVTLNGVADDSIQAQRYVLSFERLGDGKVRLTRATWAQRCARGRGHRDFEPEECT